MERITQLYKALTSREPLGIKALAGAGSNRRYFRVVGGEELSRWNTESLIAVIGINKEENETFFMLADFFKRKGLPVPELQCVSDDRMVYLQEDCGDVSLHNLMACHRLEDGTFDTEATDVLRTTIQKLPLFQFSTMEHNGGTEVFSRCFPQQAMDRVSVMFDFNYFKYCFLKLKGIEFNEYKLLQDFERFADDLLIENENTFLYRDFQSRNVMLKDGTPYFIDFQGGRRGPIYYDVVSFLWQSSAKFANSLREQLIDEYLKALQPFKPLSKLDFMPRLHLFVLFRILQVLGAYGYRGLWEKKEYFINSIPLAIRNLQQELSLGICDAYPYLKDVCKTLIALDAVEEKSRVEELAKKAKVQSYLKNDMTYTSNGISLSPGKGEKKLLVHVFSFSFKKGIPVDESGNGGGYVFDCRSTHNPGRYDEYKLLTGLDQPVIDFLEADGEILTFLESVYKLVDFHVARFIERGFTNLQISFGCTGGRHRSVYSAQHVALHIHQQFGVEVYICHREQNITQVLK